MDLFVTICCLAVHLFVEYFVFASIFMALYITLNI